MSVQPASRRPASGKTVQIRSPAKVNLFLKVLKKRPDGYHDLVSLMCPVSLFDAISLSFGRPDIRVTCSNPDIPADEANLAHRAASLFREASKVDEGVHIHIEKRIPAGAGLGGGSSNAAAVLETLNRRYGRPLSRSGLMSLGLSIGADVPFFLFGRAAIATGIGERLRAYPDLTRLPLLLIFPGFSVSTAEVFGNLNLRLTNCEKKNKDFDFKKEKFDVKCHLCNDLEAVAASLYPEITSIKEALLSSGAEGALMTGSGSSVFGLFSDTGKRAKAARLLSRRSKWQIFFADLLA